MLKKIFKLVSVSNYEKFNLIDSFLVKLKTQYIYKFSFAKIGEGSSIKNPILLKNIKKVFIGKNVFIRDHARIECVIEKDSQTFTPVLILEDGVSFEQRCHITVAGEMIIGKGTIASFDVMITDIDHEYEDLNLPVAQQPLKVSKTCIGENCFIGSGAKIQAGTILGKHCVVGTNAVVRGTFPDYSVIVGIPAKIVKRYDLERKEWRRTNAKGEFIGE